MPSRSLMCVLNWGTGSNWVITNEIMLHSEMSVAYPLEHLAMLNNVPCSWTLLLCLWSAVMTQWSLVLKWCKMPNWLKTHNTLHYNPLWSFMLKVWLAVYVTGHRNVTSGCDSPNVELATAVSWRAAFFLEPPAASTTIAKMHCPH